MKINSVVTIQVVYFHSGCIIIMQPDFFKIKIQHFQEVSNCVMLFKCYEYWNDIAQIFCCLLLLYQANHRMMFLDDIHANLCKYINVS